MTLSERQRMKGQRFQPCEKSQATRQKKDRRIAAIRYLSTGTREKAQLAHLAFVWIGNMHSTRNSCAVMHCGVPTVVISEK
jgi:hypothetical protein